MANIKTVGFFLSQSFRSVLCGFLLVYFNGSICVSKGQIWIVMVWVEPLLGCGWKVAIWTEYCVVWYRILDWLVGWLLLWWVQQGKGTRVGLHFIFRTLVWESAHLLRSYVTLKLGHRTNI